MFSRFCVLSVVLVLFGFGGPGGGFGAPGDVSFSLSSSGGLPPLLVPGGLPGNMNEHKSTLI